MAGPALNGRSACTPTGATKPATTRSTDEARRQFDQNVEHTERDRRLCLFELSVDQSDLPKTRELLKHPLLKEEARVEADPLRVRRARVVFELRDKSVESLKATEWYRFDLLVQIDAVATVIEFKYYLRRRKLGLGGEHLGFKGGPGPKNEAEFYDCVQKLRTAVLPGVADRRLILVYQRESNGRYRYSFDRSYRGLAVGDDLTDVQSLAVGPLEGRVLRPRWLGS
jgi:hypothetical protein